jgi:hypothetical protein
MKLRRRSERTSPRITLAVEAGQVVCPRRGIVDVERCWVCPAYDGLSTGHIEGVICRAEAVGLPSSVPPTAPGSA